jgi:DNA-binding transcriptional LysR family regulator
MENRLHKFAVLVESGSFSAAARELHISQPALSVAIHKLERELQAPLFIQGSRPFALTDAGKIAYQTAKEISISTSNLQMQLAEIAQAAFTLRVGMIDSIAGSIFSRPESAITFVSPATLSVMVDNSRNLAGAVEQDAIDIAFIAGEPRSISAHLSLQPLGDEPLVLVCASHIASAQQAAVALGVLPEFVSYDQRSNTFRLIETALSQHNVRTQPVVYSTSPEVTLHLVRQGRGAAVLPYQTVESLLASGELSLLSSDTALGVIARPISVAQRRDKLLPGSTNRLVRQVRRALASAAEAAETAVKSVRA